MDKNLSNYINWLSEKLPDLCTTKDLVECKLFPSASALSKARDRGKSPAYIKFPGGRITYLKQDVLDWAQSLYKKGVDETKTQVKR